jgi:hypothetical protein
MYRAKISNETSASAVADLLHAEGQKPSWASASWPSPRAKPARPACATEHAGGGGAQSARPWLERRHDDSLVARWPTKEPTHLGRHAGQERGAAELKLTAAR